MKNSSLAAGFVGWVATAIGALSQYAMQIDTYSDWSWFSVVKGGLVQLSAGLGLLSVYMYRKVGHGEPLDPVTDESPAPLERIGRIGKKLNRVMFSDNFETAELVCKGDHDCEFPGMSLMTMEILDDLRLEFGRLSMRSAYRCPAHNADVKGASDSYHMEGRAGDVRPLDGPTPKDLYDYLCEKYPDRYGFGLYRTFVHVDDRSDGVWARKPRPEAEWRQFNSKVEK